MALYPAQLTPEEKSLKKRYAKLEERRKQLHKSNEKTSQQAAVLKTNHKNLLKPKDAKEVAKKMLTTGKLTITKKSPVKKSGFKRVGQLTGKGPPAKKPNTGSETGQPPKLKVKASDQRALYKRFMNPNIFSEDLDKIPKMQHNSESTSSVKEEQQKFTSQECTILVHWYQPGIIEEALRIAFKRFGNIKTLSQDHAKNYSFITFDNPSIAVTARKEMDKGMIHGSDLSVEPATTENGYVELPPEAASNPWSQIAAGRDLTDSPLKKLDSHKDRQIISYDDVGF